MLYYVTMVIDDMTVPMQVTHVTIYGNTIIIYIDFLFLGIFGVFHFLRYERFSEKVRVILNTILLERILLVRIRRVYVVSVRNRIYWYRLWGNHHRLEMMVMNMNWPMVMVIHNWYWYWYWSNYLLQDRNWG